MAQSARRFSPTRRAVDAQGQLLRAMADILEHSLPRILEGIVSNGAGLYDVKQTLAALEPVKVDVDRRLAAAVVRTLFDPMVVPDDVADLWADAASRCAIYQTVPLYLMGSHQNVLHMQLKPGGRLHIELQNNNGERYWRGEWHRARP